MKNQIKFSVIAGLFFAFLMGSSSTVKAQAINVIVDRDVLVDTFAYLRNQECVNDFFNFVNEFSTQTVTIPPPAFLAGLTAPPDWVMLFLKSRPACQVRRIDLP